MKVLIITVIFLGIGFIISMFFLIKFFLKNKEFNQKYLPILNIEEKARNLEKEFIKDMHQKNDVKEKFENDISILRESYKTKKSIYDKLLEEIAIYDEEIELIELGFYKPHFDFDTSERFKQAITEIKNNQKTMMKNKVAITCNTEWALEGSKAKGRTMTNRGIKLTARAFNNECDVAAANIRWNNALRMEQRIQKAFDSINKLNESNHIIISPHYLELKLKELRLTHEYKEKKQQEKEEQAEIRRQMREEAKLQEEVESAIKEEEKYETLLAKAKAEAENAAGAKLSKLQEKIALLDKELAEAQEKAQRAKSMAQQTKAGHVYVISNIGSFGENVYKIGMTRRLEPLDRVKELGDASVPFSFDVHAMIHSENAPELENLLHKKFDTSRLNLVNRRKEFFNVQLDEIQKEALKLFPEAEFIETAEARQYKESLSIIAQREASEMKSEKINTSLPNEI